MKYVRYVIFENQIFFGDFFLSSKIFLFFIRTYITYKVRTEYFENYKLYNSNNCKIAKKKFPLNTINCLHRQQI